MKYILALFIALTSFGFAEAACNNTGDRDRFSHGDTVTRYFLVRKNTDCFFVPNFRGGASHVKSEIISFPKNGKAGVNDHRFMYMPNSGFTGEDTATFKVFFKNKSGNEGFSLVKMTYTVM